VLPIRSKLYLEHFFLKMGVGSSIGKTLDGLLILEMAALQMSCMEEHFFDIGRNLTMKSLENSLGRIRIVY